MPRGNHLDDLLDRTADLTLSFETDLMEMTEKIKNTHSSMNAISDAHNHLYLDASLIKEYLKDTSRKKKAAQFLSNTLLEGHGDLFSKSSFFRCLQAPRISTTIFYKKKRLFNFKKTNHTKPVNAILLTDAIAELITNGVISDTEC